MTKVVEESDDAKARRKAAKAGMIARKSRKAICPLSNRGGFMLVDAETSRVLYGRGFVLTAEDVIEAEDSCLGQSA